MDCYISSHHPVPANEVAEILQSAGHRVVSTWHVGDPPPNKIDWQERTIHNFQQIKDSEIHILVSGDDKYRGGKFVEAGYALGLGKKVVVVGRRENGMLFHPNVFLVPDPVELTRILGILK